MSELVLPHMVNGMGIDEAMDNLWLDMGDIRQYDITNPLLTSPWENPELVPELVVELCRDPAYLHFVCKYILNVDLLPYQAVILSMFWDKPLPMLIASRGAAKSFLMSVYICLRMLLHQGCRVCVVGASMRQSMVLFQYVEQIWDKAPVLQDIAGKSRVSGPKRDQHMCKWRLGDSNAVFLPLGTGDKIRGQRATHLICDEFSVIPIDIFETVVRGFAAVKSEGVKVNVSLAYKQAVMNQLGKGTAEEFEDAIHEVTGGTGSPTKLASNQIILSGTADFEFNHFYKYFDYYRKIIKSGGDKDYLQREFPEMDVPDEFNVEDYAVIRLPYDKLPPGLMDPTVLNQGRATMDPQVFDQEYLTIFSSDSAGFYLASWLHRATTPVADISFPPKIYGDKDKYYVMGIDPASEDDNFAICITEINGPWRGVVYMWTTNRRDFEEARRRGELDKGVGDYHSFCVRHIRDLARRFRTKLIVLDSGGGGHNIREGLKDTDKLLDENDVLYLDMDDEMSQGIQGQHIIKMVEFSSREWRYDSHYGLRADLQNMALLFPNYDPAELAVAEITDASLGRIFDSTEDCYSEIEECKKETILIKHTSTANGSERWDVPRVVGIDAEQVKKRLKKDRFTALLLSNWGCRWLIEEGDYEMPDQQFGGLPQDLVNYQVEGSRFLGKGAKKMKYAPTMDIDPNDAQQCLSNPNRKIFY